MPIKSPASAESMRAGDWLLQARGALIARRGLLLKNGEGAPDLQEASVEVQVLLAFVIQRSRTWLLAHPEQPLSGDQVEQLTDLLERLAEGVPLPYLTGTKEFFGLDFEVSPAVLIPRPETELLVEQAIGWLRSHPGRLRIAEAGVGSGCITVSIAKSNPALRLLAVDRSFQSLEIARRNIIRHEVASQVLLYQGNLLSAAAGPIDLVCANLPYIPGSTLADLAVARYEPRIALDGGADGLREIAALIKDAPRWLAPAGLLLLEMQYDQGEQIADLARVALPGANIRVLTDLAGLPRLVRIENA